MRIVSSIFLSAALLVVTPAAGHAQDDKAVHVNLGGGPTFNLGDFGTHFGTGWGPAIGVTVDAPSKKVAFQFEYAYRYFNIKDGAPVLGASKFSANHQTHQLDFNVVANLTPSDSKVRGYIVAGPGAYYRQVEITEYVGTGIICDPLVRVRHVPREHGGRIARRLGPRDQRRRRRRRQDRRLQRVLHRVAVPLRVGPGVPADRHAGGHRDGHGGHVERQLLAAHIRLPLLRAVCSCS